MYIELIKKLEQFISLSEKESIIIKQLFQIKKIKKNDYFLREGQVSTHICFVKKGLFRYYFDQEGEEKTFSFGHEGCFMADYESFVPQIPTLQNIQALEDSEILTISYNDLQEFYNKIKNAERFGRLAMEYAIIDVIKELKSFYKDSQKQRYEIFIQKYPEVLQRIPQYHIASYIGVKPQSLSRIRKNIFFKLT